MTPKIAWYETERFRWWCIAGFWFVVAVKAVQSIFLKDNDFAWHMALGRSVLLGTPYVSPDGGVFGTHYPPGRALIDAGFALLPYRLARTICFACAMGALLVASRVWRELTDAMQPVSPGLHFAASVFAFVLLAPWVVRDFDECGLQILLLFFISMAAWMVWRGARIAAAAWLALAITWKAAPLIFVPLLLWKRRWVAALATLGFVLVFNAIVPAVLWGPATAQQALTRYFNEFRRVATLQDPAENGVEPPTHRNQNLPFAIARYLQTYPPGHPLFINTDYADHECEPKDISDDCRADPLFVQFLDLPAATAKRVITVILSILALALAWRMRRGWSLANGPATGGYSSALAPEWAVTCALAALLAPLTWLQHLTLALPCAYIAVRETMVSPSRLRLAALGVVFLCTWILQRDPLSLRLSLIVMSYHEEVLAVLILIVMTLGTTHAIGRERNLVQAETI
jgi:hypothetical protein